MLEVNNIHKTFNGNPVLKGIDFHIEKGEVVAILGPSGSGKTTFLRCLNLLERAEQGTLRFTDGSLFLDFAKKISKADELKLRRRSSMVFQQYNLFPHRTALENVMMSQYYHSMPDEEEAMQALEAVGLKDRAKHLPSQLSGGEQQRVCIARALINHPALLLADEPTGNLDEKNEYVVMDIFEKLHNAGSTIIVVTHDPEVGDEAERMVTLEHGRIAGEEKKKRQRPVIKEGNDKFKGFV